jgi:hypothetical protein
VNAYLFHKRFGFLRATGDQWIGDKGVRYASFRADYMSIAVNLPISEVEVQFL